MGGDSPGGESRTGENRMAVTRSAVKKAPAPVRENPLSLFVWEGTDKRGIKMKG